MLYSAKICIYIFDTKQILFSIMNVLPDFTIQFVIVLFKKLWVHELGEKKKKNWTMIQINWYSLEASPDTDVKTSII